LNIGKNIKIVCTYTDLKEIENYKCDTFLVTNTFAILNMLYQFRYYYIKERHAIFK